MPTVAQCGRQSSVASGNDSAVVHVENIGEFQSSARAACSKQRGWRGRLSHADGSSQLRGSLARLRWYYDNEPGEGRPAVSRYKLLQARRRDHLQLRWQAAQHRAVRRQAGPRPPCWTEAKSRNCRYHEKSAKLKVSLDSKAAPGKLAICMPEIISVSTRTAQAEKMYSTAQKTEHAFRCLNFRAFCRTFTDNLSEDTEAQRATPGFATRPKAVRICWRRDREALGLTQ